MTENYLSVVSGTYNEVDNIESFIDRVEAAFLLIPQYRYEILIIDNCSTDGTQDILRKLAKSKAHLKVILNTRNFGHIRSPYYGLLQTTGEATIAMASDLQDPPELIVKFVEHWRNGAKAVVGVKEKSKESALFFFIRKLYYKLLGKISDAPLIENFTGFGLYDRSIIDYCRTLQDPYPYFRGIISEVGWGVTRVLYEQEQRKRGITKNNFWTLYDLAILGFTNHSRIPLRLAAMLGFLASFGSLLVAIVYFIYKILFWENFSVGMAPLVIGLFFFSSVQLFFIGILGEYIGAILVQIGKKPLVVEKERINF